MNRPFKYYNFVLGFICIYLFSSCSSITGPKKRLNNLVGSSSKSLAKPKANSRRSSYHRKFSPLWIKNLDPIYESGNLPIGTSSPYIYEGILYIGDLRGKMSAFDLSSGRVLWEVSENKELSGRANVFNDLLVYGSKEGRLFARDYYTGKLKYAIDLGASIEGHPTFYGARMFLHLRDHRIIAMDAATGKVLWSYKRSLTLNTTLQRVSGVLPFENKILVGFADGYLVSLSQEEGVTIWEQKLSNKNKFIDVDITPTYFNDIVVAGSAAGQVKFVNPKSGVIEKSLPLTIQAKPLKVEDTLVLGTDTGEVVIVSSSGKILKRKELMSSGVSSLAKWKERLVISSMSGKILLVDLKSLKVLNSFELGHEQSAVFGEISTWKDYFALFSSRNRLYVFK